MTKWDLALGTDHDKEMRDELQKGIKLAKEDLHKLSEDIRDGVSKLTELATMAASTGGCPHVL